MTVEEQMRIIKLIREGTGYPIIQIKKALIECDFDIETAFKKLR